MKVEEGIKSLGEMFKAMKIETMDGEPVIYVTVKFPENWTVDSDEVKEKFGVQYLLNDGLSYFFTSLENGSDKLFEAISLNQQRNKEAQERLDAYNLKKKELLGVYQSALADLEKAFNNKEISTDALKNMSIAIQGITSAQGEASKKKDKKEEKESK